MSGPEHPGDERHPDDERHRDRDEERALWEVARHEAWQDLTGPNGFVPVFALTLAAIVVMQADDGWKHGPLVSTVLLTAVVILSFSRAGAPRAWRWTAIGCIGIAVVVGIVDVVTSDVPSDQIDTIGSAPAALLAVSLFMTLPAVLGAAFAHARITLNTVTAAITAYLLLGLVFASVFRAIDLATTQPFFNQQDVARQADFVYFSFVTLTTVGYGDMTAATGLGRGLATLEALVGQIYLVTTVAVLVSRLGQERQRPGRPGPAG